MTPVLLLLVAGAALGARPAPAPIESAAESTQDRWVSMKDLSLVKGLVRPLTVPVDLSQGPERLHLEGGYLVPVFSGKMAGEWESTVDAWLARQDPNAVPRAPSSEERGRQQLVGWVWTGGTGTVALNLPDRADAMILANRLVTKLGVPASAVAEFAHGRGGLTEPVTDAIVLGVDPKLAEIYAGPNHADPYDIVVFGAREGDKATSRAASLLRERTSVWTALKQLPGERIAWDRIGVERAAVPPTDGFALWDLATAQRFGLVAPQSGGEADQALTVVTDPTGAHDARREVRVASWGLSPGGDIVDGLIGGIPHPPSDPSDPTSPPLPRRRVDPVHAVSTIAVQPTPNALDLAVRVDNELTFRAVGPVAWIDLELPKMEALPGSFEILTAELADGTPLLGRAAEKHDAKVARVEIPLPPRPGPGPQPAPEPAPREPEPPPERGTATIRLQLPAVVPDGGEIQVHLVHQDSWPYASFSEVDGGMALGLSSGLQGFLPTVPPRDLGSPWSYDAKVAVPEGGKISAAVSGRTVREWSQDGWALTETDSEGQTVWFPQVAAGRFTALDDPAQQGFPAVRVRTLGTHYGTNDSFAPEVRRIVQVYQGFLPPYPVSEVEVFEAPAAFMSYGWIAPYGMVDLQTSWVGMGDFSDLPHLENGLLAHELAHQYFGNLAPPGAIDDFWIAESYAELFSCVYLAAAFGGHDCDVRLEKKRARWEGAETPDQVASLTAAYSFAPPIQRDIVYGFGPYVLFHMLQGRIGPAAFYGATDVLLRDHPHQALTTERLQAYLEAASGKDLDDFFSFWIEGGYVPRLSLVWTAKGGHVTGDLRSDVPFGTFDVPVVAHRKEGDPVTGWVRVVDGVGKVDLAVPGKVTKVEVDPGGMVLAHARDSRPAKEKPGR